MKSREPSFDTALLAYSRRGRALASVLCSLIACVAASWTVSGHLASCPPFALCAPSFTCGVFAVLAFDAASVSGRRWIYAAAGAAFAALGTSAATLAASALRAIDQRP